MSTAELLCRCRSFERSVRRCESEAVLRLLETTECQASNESAEAYIARRLGLDGDAVQTLLHELLRAKIIEQRGTRYAVIDNLTVDTGTNIDLLHDLRSHRARVGLQRLEAHAPCDWFAYNLITVSEEDARRIELRLRAAYREVRAIVAESSPGEVAALLTLHLVRW